MNLEKYREVLERTEAIFIDGKNYQLYDALISPRMGLCGNMSGALGYLLSKNEKFSNIESVRILNITPIPKLPIQVRDHAFLKFIYEGEEYIADPTYLQFFGHLENSHPLTKFHILCCKVSEIENVIRQIIGNLGDLEKIYEVDFNWIFNFCNIVWNLNLENKDRKIKEFNSDEIFANMRHRNLAIDYLDSIKKKN